MGTNICMNCVANCCDAMLCYAMLCYALLCYAMLCYAMLCYAMLCCAMLCYAMLCYVMLCYAVRSLLCCAAVWCAYWPAGGMERGGHRYHDDALQELPGLVNGGVGIKAAAAGGKLVMQDGLQLLCQAVSLLLQLGLLLLCGQSILLQLLIVPANHPTITSARVLNCVKIATLEFKTW